MVCGKAHIYIMTVLNCSTCVHVRVHIGCVTLCMLHQGPIDSLVTCNTVSLCKTNSGVLNLVVLYYIVESYCERIEHLNEM